MNIKTTITLLDIGLKRWFIKCSFHFEGMLLTGERMHFHVQGVLARPQIP